MLDVVLPAFEKSYALAVEELGIEVGQRALALLKASALHVWRCSDSGLVQRRR
jgi:hypothetical protein